IANLALLLLASACVAHGGPKAPLVDRPMRAPVGNEVILRASAKGVQVYVCEEVKSEGAARYEWVLRGPSAELYDEHDSRIGTRYKGPTWQAQDGSKVLCEVKEKQLAPSGAIPWLLLKAKAHEGAGTMSRVSWVQRVDTVGGNPPTTACDAAHAGEDER